MAQQRSKEEQEGFRLQADIPHDYVPESDDPGETMPCANCARGKSAPVHLS